ncbi:MAG: hypothetical protein JF593_01945 [Novosphingobium sp.]|nr:hypothetical protein [Novosphingobium sp.]
MIERRLAQLAGTIALALPLPALAAPAVALDSAVFVEHVQAAPNGMLRSLEPARRVASGDRVVTIVSWTRSGPGSFTVTNPLPRGLEYEQSAEGDEEVSADGGRTWGKLGTLRISGRLATAEDLTHVRWHVTGPRAASPSGRIAYSGIVR